MERTPNIPLSVTELLQLTHLGVPLEHITWPRVSITASNFICIRHNRKRRCGKGKNSVITVLNPHKGFPQTWESTAGSVKMNPVQPLIALKAGPLFQVYNLDTRHLLGKHRTSYKVVYWTWINAKMIAMVTDTSVYHWNVVDGGVPTVAFHRHPRLGSAEIVNYVVDDGLRWHALVGLTVEDDKIGGQTQLYSSDYGLSQPIECHSVCFAQYRFPGNQFPSTVMVAVSRGEGTSGKIHVMELGPVVQGNQAPVNISETITFTDQWGKYDFPVSVQVSTKLGLIYVLTKHGRLQVADLETGVVLITTFVSADIIFTSAINLETEGIMAVSRNGQVLSIDLKKEAIVKYVQHVVKRPGVSQRLRQVLE